MKRYLTMIFILALLANAGAVPIAAPVNWITKQQDVYRKIEVTDVYTNVLKNISDNYNGYSVSEAWISEENGYKLELVKKERSLMVYYKSTGEFIKEEVK